MGRPRKEDLSFKEQQLELPGVEEVDGNQLVAELQPANPTPIYVGVAISIWTNPKTQSQQVIEIPFTGDLQAGVPKTISEADGKGMATERFKIEAQNRILDKL